MTPCRTALALSLAIAFTAPAAAEQTVSYQNLLEPLFNGNETVIGQTIAYPEGTPRITAAIVVLPPASETKWHSHEVPLFVYVFEGEITVDYGSKGTKTYKAGDSLLEAVDWPHNGTNTGDAPTRLLAVYMGAEGKADAALASGAQ